MAVFSSTGKVKHNFTNSSFIATSLVLLLILFIRVTRGLDLTDEMQYYGEIKGLIETGRLFSNDLFIQQSVYILLYPAFYIYHALLGFEGLVFFGRLLMAALSITVFLYAYRKFLEFKFSFLVASLTALCLTFAIPYHGIFAPSYNTISQVLWIIFTIRFFEWKQRSTISWGAIPVITAFAHPTSAVMMALLVLLRFSIERNFWQAAKVMLALLGGALIALPIVLYFATPQEYLASITFSSGYGVGSTFLSNKVHLVVLFFIYATFGVSYYFWMRYTKLHLSLLSIFGLTTAIFLYMSGIVSGGYSLAAVCILSSLSALAYGLAQLNVSVGDDKLMRRIHWLAVALLLFATTLGITSGNGIGQATGAFMIGLPLLLGIALCSETNKEGPDNTLMKHPAASYGVLNPNLDKSFAASGVVYDLKKLKIICVILVTTLFVLHWSRCPYRETVWWQVNLPIQSVPEFKFISTSQDRAAFLQRMKHELEPVVQGKRTLIVSEYPGLYLALGARAETCMLYMHSLISDKSENALLNCLSKIQPEIVIDVLADKDNAQVDSRIKKVVQSYYSQLGFNCGSGTIEFNPVEKNNPEQLSYTVCK